MPHPIIHSSLSNPEANQKPPKIADCLSCRLWGGVVHVGIAGFVASHIKEMQSRGAKGFLIAFSSGKHANEEEETFLLHSSMHLQRKLHIGFQFHNSHVSKKDKVV